MIIWDGLVVLKSVIVIVGWKLRIESFDYNLICLDYLFLWFIGNVKFYVVDRFLYLLR